MQDRILIGALCEILEQCRSEKFKIVYLEKEDRGESGSTVNGDGASCDNGTSESSSDMLSPERFHKDVRIRLFANLEDVEKYYFENSQKLKEQYGILMFLYSVIATRVSYVIQNDTHKYIIYFLRAYKKFEVNRTPQNHL